VKALLLGGTRFLGRSVARRLVELGAEVTVVHRGVTGEAVDGTESVTADRTQPGSLRVLDGRRFDVVLDLSGYFSDWTRDAIDTLGGRAFHYVFISSGAVYKPSPELPWSESLPYGPVPIWGRYGEEKIASERMLWQAYAEGRFAVTMFRFPFILGPGNFADRESFVFSRLEAGTPILLPGGGVALNQFVYVEDAADALVAAMLRPDATAGEAYNCTYSGAITNRGWVELCAAVAGRDPWIVDVDEDALGVSAETVDLTNIVFPYPAEHYVLDGRKLKEDLGVGCTTGHLRMLQEFAEWWSRVEDHSPRVYEREQRALAALDLDGR
jgi:nucleoside-diphosphate-sugar epimerase